MRKAVTRRALQKILRKTDRRWEKRLLACQEAWEKQRPTPTPPSPPPPPVVEPAIDPSTPPPWDGRWGGFIDQLIIPACPTLFAGFGLPLPAAEIHTRLTPKLPIGRYMRIDLLLATDTIAVAMLVSSHLTVEEVQGHRRQLPELTEFLPAYGHHRIYGAVAGITVEEEAERLALAQGLFVIRRSGETVELANGVDFVPKTW